MKLKQKKKRYELLGKRQEYRPEGEEMDKEKM